MTTPDMNTFEQQLIEALHQEASLAMTLTDTPRELRRWRDGQRHRRNRARIVAIVATAAAAVGLILGLTKLGSTTSGRPEPAHKPTAVSPHRATIQTLQPLPTSVAPAVLHGPGTVDAVAFGAAWGMDTTDQPRFVYRMSADGARVIGRTDLHRYIGDPVPLFRVGSVLLVPAVNGPGHGGYVVLDRNGRRTGFIPASSAGAGGGDASGGWVQTDIDRIAQVDASGHLTGATVQLPNDSVTTVAVGAGAVWVGTVTDELYKVDPTTATITGKLTAPNQPMQIVTTPAAVYVATDGFQLLRVDPLTLRTTAVNENNVNPGAIDQIALGPDDSLWIAPDQRGAAELDPITLEVTRTMQVNKAQEPGGNFGIGLLGGRLFIGDGVNHRVVSFPVK